jgi:hypothetical protein
MQVYSIPAFQVVERLRTMPEHSIQRVLSETLYALKRQVRSGSTMRGGGMAVPHRAARWLGCSIVALGVASPVAAQTIPRAEVSAGYQFLNVSVEGESESLGAGWVRRV